MISNLGLDFDNIELVAIPKADALLYVQGFQSGRKSLSINYAGFKSGETLEKKFISKLIILIIRFLN